MSFLRGISALLLAMAALSARAQKVDFNWDWHDQEVIGHNDASLNSTSKLTEPDRTALLEAIVLRLQKPMSERGYDDQRIREIASTTRLRFVDLGDGKPVILATSIGMEGGCDALVNCPFWIFRHTEDGYVSLLESTAASYTVQPTSTNGLSDLVTAQNITTNQTSLTLYKYADGKYADMGCKTATFPPAKNGEIQAPDFTPCKPDAEKPHDEKGR